MFEKMKFRETPAKWREFAAAWLKEWNIKEALEEDAAKGDDPFAGMPPIPSLPAPRPTSQEPEPKAGQIRLLHPDLCDVECLVYVALVDDWEGGMLLTAPFSHFSVPAVEGELLTGRKANSLRVLELWSAVSASKFVLSHSWLVDEMSRQEMLDAKAVFKGVMTGAPLSKELEDRTAAPIYNPLDPRLHYQDEETAKVIALDELSALQMTAESAIRDAQWNISTAIGTCGVYLCDMSALEQCNEDGTSPINERTAAGSAGIVKNSAEEIAFKFARTELSKPGRICLLVDMEEKRALGRTFSNVRGQAVFDLQPEEARDCDAHPERYAIVVLKRAKDEAIKQNVILFDAYFQAMDERIAADSPTPALTQSVTLEDMGVTLDFLGISEGKTTEVNVYDKAGEYSDKLDGWTLADRNGVMLATIRGHYAALGTEMLRNGVIPTPPAKGSDFVL